MLIESIGCILQVVCAAPPSTEEVLLTAGERQKFSTSAKVGILICIAAFKSIDQANAQAKEGGGGGSFFCRVGSVDLVNESVGSFLCRVESVKLALTK